jgi:hypothetical protein
MKKIINGNNIVLNYNISKLDTIEQDNIILSISNDLLNFMIGKSSWIMVKNFSGKKKLQKLLFLH